MCPKEGAIGIAAKSTTLSMTSSSNIKTKCLKRSSVLLGLVLALFLTVSQTANLFHRTAHFIDEFDQAPDHVCSVAQSAELGGDMPRRAFLPPHPAFEKSLCLPDRSRESSGVWANGSPPATGPPPLV